MKIELFALVNWKSLGLGIVLRVDFRWKNAEVRFIVGPFMAVLGVSMKP